VRHQRSGKKLGRDSAHRKALYANLAGALIEHGRIRTTVTKAKAVRPIAEQMITLGRRGDLHARRQAKAFLRSQDVVHKLFSEVGPSFAERPGGYTRIVRIGPRPGDAADMVYLELVDSQLVFKTRLPKDDETVAAAPAIVAEEDEVEETEAEEEAESEAESDDADAEAEAELAAEDDDAEADDAEPEEAEADADDAEAEAGDAEPEPEK
jgi:large subunit ribosomal protein L17